MKDNKGNIMATSDLEGMFDDWAMAWSSNDPELIPALFVDDCFSRTLLSA